MLNVRLIEVSSTLTTELFIFSTFRLPLRLDFRRELWCFLISQKLRYLSIKLLVHRENLTINIAKLYNRRIYLYFVFIIIPSFIIFHVFYLFFRSWSPLLKKFISRQDKFYWQPVLALKIIKFLSFFEMLFSRFYSYFYVFLCTVLFLFIFVLSFLNLLLILSSLFYTFLSLLNLSSLNII